MSSVLIGEGIPPVDAGRGRTRPAAEPRSNKTGQPKLFSVRLANGKVFRANDNETLLDAAERQGLILEHSCRTGQCGSCKTRVEQGSTRILQAEQCLSEADIQSGLILTCCRGPSSQLSLAAEDLGRYADLQIKTLPCRIDSLEAVAPDVLRVILRLPPNADFHYYAGQYIRVIGRAGVRRSYSIACLGPSNKLELHIREVKGGAMSRYWFEEAKVNDLLRFEGPFGTCGLREQLPEKVVFLATGTGIAPIKALLEELASDSKLSAEKEIHLYWGGRKPEDLYWAPKIEGLDISYTPVLSQAPESYTGRRGYVQSALLEDMQSLERTAVFACGSYKMIESARKALLNHGLDPSLFYSDAFVSSS